MMGLSTQPTFLRQADEEDNNVFQDPYLEHFMADVHQMDEELFQPTSIDSPILPQEEASSMSGMFAPPPQDSSFPIHKT